MIKGNDINKFLSLALRMESRLKKIFSMGINSMSLAVWLGKERKFSVAEFKKAEQ